MIHIDVRNHNINHVGEAERTKGGMESGGRLRLKRGRYVPNF